MLICKDYGRVTGPFYVRYPSEYHKWRVDFLMTRTYWLALDFTHQVNQFRAVGEEGREFKMWLVDSPLFNRASRVIQKYYSRYDTRGARVDRDDRNTPGGPQQSAIRSSPYRQHSPRQYYTSQMRRMPSFSDSYGSDNYGQQRNQRNSNNRNRSNEATIRIMLIN